MFEHVEPFGGDPILSLNEDFQKDPRPHKINLSIGIYFDDEGRIPVLDSVRRAEQQVVARDAPKPYLPIEGAANFRGAVQALLFGADHEAIAAGRVATIQSVGSSGGLKVGADFIARWLPGSAVWVSDPSWENHRSMFEGAGLAVHDYPYYDAATGGLAFDAMCAALRAPAGEERRPAARVLPQPDRRRPDARPVGRAGADPGRARARALPRPRLPGLRRRHRRGRLRAARARRRARPRRPAARLLRRQLVLEEHEPVRRALRRAQRRLRRCRRSEQRPRPAQVHGAPQLLEPADPRRPDRRRRAERAGAAARLGSRARGDARAHPGDAHARCTACSPPRCPDATSATSSASTACSATPACRRARSIACATSSRSTWCARAGCASPG